VASGTLQAADGPYTVSVSYPGGADVAPAAAAITQTVAPANSRTRIQTTRAGLGEPAVVTASVSGLPARAGTPTGTVTFAVSDASGQAQSCVAGNTVSLAVGAATCTMAPPAAGQFYVVTATYNGDGNFNPSTSRAIRAR
jgi:Bacterial Ig-like domain (group 3)